MDALQHWTFWLTALLIVATPGTGAIYTLAAGLSQGPRAGVWAAFASTLGIVPHVAAALTGLAALLHASAMAFSAVKWLGVAYLLYMAWGMFNDRGALRVTTDVARKPALRVLVDGVALNLLNPKLSIFFVAFLPQFVARDAERPLLDMTAQSVAFMALTFFRFRALWRCRRRGPANSHRTAEGSGLAAAFVRAGLRYARGKAGGGRSLGGRRLTVAPLHRRASGDVLTAPHGRPRGPETMREADSTRSGKTSQTENFPVASWLVRAEHRPIIMAYYDFARCADDIADAPDLAAEEKVRRLDRMEAGLHGEVEDEPEARALRGALKARGLSPRHAHDLLIAFRADATKLRYADWWELMGYCAYSANPVGRFVLDAHGEDESLWPASDAICSALQIVNHLQDCADDYKKLDRVYIPLDRLAAHGLNVEALGEARASPPLRALIGELAEKTLALLREGRGLAGRLRDRRLQLEIDVIYALAEAHCDRLMTRDPLSERTKLPRWRMGALALRTVASGLLRGPRGGAAAEAMS